MAESVLRDKSKEFATQVIFVCRVLKKNGIEYALVNQLMRSDTSIGANVH